MARIQSCFRCLAEEEKIARWKRLKQDKTVEVVRDEIKAYNKILKAEDIGAIIYGLEHEDCCVLKLFIRNESFKNALFAETIADMLEKNYKCLKHLDLKCDHVRVNDAKVIMDGLSKNTTITNLTLNLDTDGRATKIENMVAVSKGIACVLQNKDCSLQYLNLGDNCLDFNFGSGRVRDLIPDALKNNGSLINLNLRRCRLRSHGSVCTRIGEMLKVNMSLKLLDLTNNSLDGFTDYIVDGLKVNKTLTTLKLGSNSIGNHVAKNIAEMLQVNCSLKQLALQNNNLADQAAESFGRMLENNSSLQRLDLSNNFIGNKGRSALSRALGKNETLHTLELDKYNNSVEDHNIQHYVARNKAKHMIKRNCMATRDEWIESLIKIRKDVIVVFYVLKDLPCLCQQKKH